MLSLMQKFWSDDSGQGLTEYALVLALVSIGLIAVLVIFRDAIGGIFDRNRPGSSGGAVGGASRPEADFSFFSLLRASGGGPTTLAVHPAL